MGKPVLFHQGKQTTGFAILQVFSSLEAEKLVKLTFCLASTILLSRSDGIIFPLEQERVISVTWNQLLLLLLHLIGNPKKEQSDFLDQELCCIEEDRKTLSSSLGFTLFI